MTQLASIPPFIGWMAFKGLLVIKKFPNFANKIPKAVCWYLYCFWFLSVSCDVGKPELDAEQSERYLVGTLDLPVDSLANYEFHMVQYLEGKDKETLVVLNNVSNSLDFYDLDKEI